MFQAIGKPPMAAPQHCADGATLNSISLAVRGFAAVHRSGLNVPGNTQTSIPVGYANEYSKK